MCFRCRSDFVVWIFNWGEKRVSDESVEYQDTFLYLYNHPSYSIFVVVLLSYYTYYPIYQFKESKFRLYM